MMNPQVCTGLYGLKCIPYRRRIFGARFEVRGEKNSHERNVPGPVPLQVGSYFNLEVTRLLYGAAQIIAVSVDICISSFRTSFQAISFGT